MRAATARGWHLCLHMPEEIVAISAGRLCNRGRPAAPGQSASCSGMVSSGHCPRSPPSDGRRPGAVSDTAGPDGVRPYIPPWG
jgi:hypothetical protein